MTEHKLYVANPVVSCGDEGDGGAVLFNPDTDDLAVVNFTGKTIWNLLASPRTIDEIVADLEGTFNIASSVEKTAGEVEEFLKSLAPDFVQEVVP